MTSIRSFSSSPLSAARGLLLVLALAAGLTGCASYAPPGGPQPGAIEVRQGVIEQINASQLQGPSHAGVGAIIGGIAGAGLGNLIGRGNGRAVATVLGSLGGGFLGNEIQQADFDRPLPAQQVVVRVDNGVIVAVTQPVNPALYPGMRVYLEGSGVNARVVPR
ncbi:glycine zipper 2TM domain-containing protein [Variovorax sp. KK3]|uniref:glycine zipper 2TM domain-containing protein n=1 Tax=Variovorax sp. KK3 TaxID=1855728 RepID=UPI0009F8727B|nr:glycine zipper 2TM domain-containing protein [Variovorax sp. KK3]